MTRIQALIIGMLIGIVTLVFIGLIIIIFLDPKRQVLPATPSATPLLSIFTSTPTLPDFLPTASLVPTLVKPTATNTRLPTMTPRPHTTPSATIVFKLPTLALRATATPTKQPVTAPKPTVPPSPSPLPTAGPRSYSVSFRAKKTKIVKGKCTDLEWTTEGVTMVMLDGLVVATSDEKEVCPTHDTSYELTIQLPNSTQLQSKTVNISVTDEEDE